MWRCFNNHLYGHDIKTWHKLKRQRLEQAITNSHQYHVPENVGVDGIDYKNPDLKEVLPCQRGGKGWHLRLPRQAERRLVGEKSRVAW